MKSPLRFVLTLNLIFAALTAAALVWGRLISQPTAEIGVCSGDPCVLGLRPGITRWGEIRPELVGQTVDASLQNWLTVQLDRDKIFIYPSTDGTTVVHVDLFHAGGLLAGGDNTLSVASILKLYGVPCGINMDYPNGEARLHYPALVINVGLIRGNLRPTSPLKDIRFYDSADLQRQRIDFCRNDYRVDSAPWFGFASTWKYILTGQ